MGPLVSDAQNGGSNAQFLQPLARLIVIIIGLILMGFGLHYAVLLFREIYAMVHNPDTIQVVLQKWDVVLGGDSLSIPLAGLNYPVARILSVSFLGIGYFLLCWIAMGLVFTGAKVVATAVNEKEVIKKILRYVMHGSRN